MLTIPCCIAGPDAAFIREVLSFRIPMFKSSVVPVTSSGSAYDRLPFRPSYRDRPYAVVQRRCLSVPK